MCTCSVYHEHLMSGAAENHVLQGKIKESARVATFSVPSRAHRRVNSLKTGQFAPPFFFRIDSILVSCFIRSVFFLSSPGSIPWAFPSENYFISWHNVWFVNFQWTVLKRYLKRCVLSRPNGLIIFPLAPLSVLYFLDFCLCLSLRLSLFFVGCCLEIFSCPSFALQVKRKMR